MQDVQSHTIELPPVAMSRMGLLVAPCSDDRSQPQQEQAVLLVARLTENSIGVEGNFLDDAGKSSPAHPYDPADVIVVGVGKKH
jgi:hypothetical protein